MITQSIYFSISCSLNIENDVEDIVERSRVNNPNMGLTGLLLHSGGSYMQVLEGPADAVKTMLERIAQDPRHTDFVPMINQTVNQRSFPDWSMGCRRIADDHPMAAEIAWLKTVGTVEANAERIQTNILHAIRGFA